MGEILEVQVDVAFWLGLLGTTFGAFVGSFLLASWLKPFDLGKTQRDFDELDRDRERWVDEWIVFQNRVTPLVASRVGIAGTFRLTEPDWDDSVLPIDLSFERRRLLRRMIEIRERSARLYKSIGA